MDANFAWIPWALLSAVAGAILATLTKVGLKDVDPDVGLAIQTLVVVVFAWSTLALRGHWRQMADLDRQAWTCLLMAGVVTSASYLFLFSAVKLGDVSRVVPVDRLSLVFAIIFGVCILKEWVSVVTGVGAALWQWGPY